MKGLDLRDVIQRARATRDDAAEAIEEARDAMRLAWRDVPWWVRDSDGFKEGYAEGAA